MKRIIMSLLLMFVAGLWSTNAYAKHKVVKGEHFWKIHKMYKVPFEELKALNRDKLVHPGNFDLIYPDQELDIPIRIENVEVSSNGVIAKAVIAKEVVTIEIVVKVVVECEPAKAQAIINIESEKPIIVEKSEFPEEQIKESVQTSMQSEPEVSQQLVASIDQSASDPILAEPAQVAAPSVIVVASDVGAAVLLAKASIPAVNNVVTEKPSADMENTAPVNAEEETKIPPTENSSQLFGEKPSSEDCGVFRSVNHVSDTFRIITEMKGMSCEDQQILREILLKKNKITVD